MKSDEIIQNILKFTFDLHFILIWTQKTNFGTVCKYGVWLLK